MADGRGPPSPATAILLTVGLTVLGIAFAVRRVEVPDSVFWLVIALSCAFLAMGLLSMRRDLPRHRSSARKREARQPALVATQCRHLHDALAVFAAECARERPRPSLFANGSARVRQWQEHAMTRYREEYQEWAVGVFDDAVECGGVAASARSLVEAPTMSQLETLADVFRDAAETLERRRVAKAPQR